MDLGGTRIKSVIISETGETMAQKETFTEDKKRGITWQDQLWKLAKDSVASSKGNVDWLRGVGIAAPGIVNSDHSSIRKMPGRLAGLENFNFSNALGCSTVVINDAHAACLAEYNLQYLPKGVQNLCMLTLGTGVGGAAIVNGLLLEGHEKKAGHFGHITVDYHGPNTMTGMPGSLEYAIGNFSVSNRTAGMFRDTRELLRAYENGDTLATFWWLQSIQKLAVGVASLINAFSPEYFVLGGGITAGAGSALLDPLTEFMSLYEWRPDGKKVPLVPASQEEYAGALGAAFFAQMTDKKNG